MTGPSSGIYSIRLAFREKAWVGVDDGMRVLHVVENPQRFFVRQVDDGRYTIQVLDIPGPGPFLRGSDAYIRFGDEQYLWVISTSGDGTYTITETFSSPPYRLWTLGPHPTTGTPVHLEGETPPPPVQKWSFHPVLNGSE
ncbi:hypothetical protein EV363DRAFT_1188053 [Boletus edulis]|uniref:Uncharacterized protein n=1 Tax=Boletus edulis BED1 TaxID=1328754 RepID=A0AAD4G7C6_BOLED|nr:hypothetical protein EV363DRAFT_1188053 [Boletus edulis]KAF8422608.1 hypothetical protein L210DRAFT_3654031 [Boletus edulis BED1]